jgi:hypothetical protein
LVTTDVKDAEMRARQRARYLTGLLWHLGAFIIVNGAFWIMDLTLGASGLQWAYWITAVWGFALAFHLLAYFVNGRQLEDRKSMQYLEEEERRREAQIP